MFVLESSRQHKTAARIQVLWKGHSLWCLQGIFLLFWVTVLFLFSLGKKKRFEVQICERSVGNVYEMSAFHFSLKSLILYREIKSMLFHIFNCVGCAWIHQSVKADIQHHAASEDSGVSFIRGFWAESGWPEVAYQKCYWSGFPVFADSGLEELWGPFRLYDSVMHKIRFPKPDHWETPTRLNKHSLGIL